MPNIMLLEDTHEDEPSVNLCKICSTATGKYTCPRCNVTYCSVACYQAEAHSSCSEAFYRDCVLQDMGAQDGDPESERKMMEILQRLQQKDADDIEDLDSDDEGDEQDLADRLTSVNLDDADSVWEKLTPAERQEFEDLVNSGDVTELLPVWKPWWTFKMEKKLVEDIESGSKDDDYTVKCPRIKTDVPALSNISKAAPSPLVKYNVMNLLGAYCYMTRWFNGDHLDFSTEALQTMVSLSGNLGQGHNYQTAEMALEAVSHEAINRTWLCASPESNKTMKSDVSCILSGPEESNSIFYIRAALSDIHALLLMSKKAKSADTASQFARRFGDSVNASAKPAITKEKLRLYMKKVEYLLSWTKDYASLSF